MTYAVETVHNHRPKVVGYDCTRPTSSRVYQAHGSCSLPEELNNRKAVATIYQHVPETRPTGWSCTLVVTSHVRYCGVASYTQTIPVGQTEETRRVSTSECVDWVNKKQVVLEDGRKHRVEVPRESYLFIQVAGSEVISDGVMTCQGENRHINGQFLRNVIVDEQTKVIIRREEFVEIQGKMQSETDQVKIQCDVTQGGCEGEDRTYIWTPVREDVPTKR